MDFSIPCECGRQIVVSEGSAGARIPCSCGRLVDIPSLGALRTSVGLPAVDVPLDIQVWTLLESGELPPANCLGCGGDAELISYVAECEHTHTEVSSDTWPLLQGIVFAMGLVANFLVFTYRTDESDETSTQVHGREVNIPVPIHCCGACRQTLISMPPGRLWKPFGTVLAWTGLIAVLVGFYIAGAILIAAGLAMHWTDSVQRDRHQRSIKDLLCKVPFYKQVLEKYPSAVIEIHRP